MMTSAVSAFMLERYRLGELNPDDQQAITELLKTDDELRSRIHQLDESDRELRLLYPRLLLKTSLPLKALETPRVSQRRFISKKARTFIRITGVAALLAAGILLPVLYVVRTTNVPKIKNGASMAAVPQDLQGLNPEGANFGERTKGSALENSELAIYLMGEQENVLPNQTVLEEGSTVQLAYTVPAGAEYYGVIVSIDGRAAVTMHYPYRRGQSSLLISGKRTFLNEAYILDDAPDYEIFVMVVSEKPLDAEMILREIQGIADETPLLIEEESRTIFDDCEVETLTILKKQR